MSTVPSTNGNRYLTGLFPLLWISILGFILYGQTITFDYTYLDDHELILGRLEQLGHPDQIAKAFTEDAFHTPGSKAYYYRPILTVSFVADRIIGGGSFAMFHVTNIILHILASGLLFLLLAEMGYDRLKSFLFTLIFVVHPVLVHAVAWVPGRNDTLLAVFVFASFLFFLRYIKTCHSSLFILPPCPFYQGDRHRPSGNLLHLRASDKREEYESNHGPLAGMGHHHSCMDRSPVPCPGRLARLSRFRIPGINHP